MDGGRRIAESLSHEFVRTWRRTAEICIDLQRVLRRWLKPVLELEPPRGIGTIACALFLLATAGFGVMRGGRVAAVMQELREARDGTANFFGFRITEVSMTGQYQLTEQEILASAGITGRSSLLFLDAAAVRTALMANPWVSDATVLKLFPGRLHIAITERDPFALWQKDGKVSVIAADGTVLETVVALQFAALPLVVGNGADAAAKNFLALLDRYPAIRAQVQASVLVAERHWNLHLKNGIDVRLPETGVESAIEALIELDRSKKLLSRDIVSVDLRLPDRVTVRLSDGAAQAREELIREREKEDARKFKRAGGRA